MTTASFDVDVTPEHNLKFAEISGDWNPLHTDPAYAASTPYGRPIIHGAFSAGLLSRLAGMYMPGRDCLLHGLRLRFVRPIVPPRKLVVRGQLVSPGRVEATVSDRENGTLYTEGSYEFGLHEHIGQSAVAPPARAASDTTTRVLVTGAGGGLGSALLARLGNEGLGASRRDGSDIVAVDAADIDGKLPPDMRLNAIVHCGWPTPDNRRLVGHAMPEAAIEAQIAAPLRDIQALATLLAARGTDGAVLVLIGSAFAEPGRHGFRTPLYSIAKSMLPTVTRVLSLELAAKNRRCVSVVFDVISGGMNSEISPASKQAHADRLPHGELPDMQQAADQIAWVLTNNSALVSGAIISLTGSALP